MTCPISPCLSHPSQIHVFTHQHTDNFPCYRGVKRDFAETLLASVFSLISTVEVSIKYTATTLVIITGAIDGLSQLEATCSDYDDDNEERDGAQHDAGYPKTICTTLLRSEPTER